MGVLALKGVHNCYDYFDRRYQSHCEEDCRADRADHGKDERRGQDHRRALMHRSAAQRSARERGGLDAASGAVEPPPGSSEPQRPAARHTRQTVLKGEP